LNLEAFFACLNVKLKMLFALAGQPVARISQGLVAAASTATAAAGTATASTAAAVWATETAVAATATGTAAASAATVATTARAIATTTTTAVATTAAEAAGTWRTSFHRTGFVHDNATAAQRLAVHAVDGRLCFRIAGHFDKTETL
jgi:hypothetical protein